MMRKLTFFLEEMAYFYEPDLPDVSQKTNKKLTSALSFKVWDKHKGGAMTLRPKPFKQRTKDIKIGYCVDSVEELKKFKGG